MLSLKILFQFIFILSMIYGQINITVYNQGRALIQEFRELNLNKKGTQSVSIRNIPNTADPSSINLLSENIQFISKEFLNKPITIQTILNASIGENIELVKYGEDGKISFSTMGKLISNINQPIFEIDGNVVLNPPYSYRFKNIPDGIYDYPYLQCVIQAKSRKNNYHLSYITTGMNWNAEYNLFLMPDKKCNVEGWYSIHNDLNLNYVDVDISMVSGIVNFETLESASSFTNNRIKTTTSYNNNLTTPIITETDEYSVFHLPNKINLTPKSQIRHQFVSRNQVPYYNIYHISHFLQRSHRSTEAQTKKIPVNVRLELHAEDIGDFQLPGGSYKVYEQNNDTLTYVGAGTASITKGSDKIKLETGKTRDILCTFTIKDYEIHRNLGEAEINAVFENRKDETISVVWIEKFSDSRWDIYKSSNDYERLDAYTAQFNIIIPANSKEKVSFNARIEKN